MTLAGIIKADSIKESHDAHARSCHLFHNRWRWPFRLQAVPTNSTSSREKVIGVEKHKNIRVVYDDKDDVWDAGIGKGLYYLRGLLESYKALKVSPKQLKISIVLHGDTAYWLLNDQAYQQYKNDPFTYNPNAKVVEELLGHGVSVEICRVTMQAHGFVPRGLAARRGHGARCLHPPDRPSAAGLCLYPVLNDGQI